MPAMLVATAAPDPLEPVTRTGGRPLAPAGLLTWPSCKKCSGAMQFLSQVRLADVGNPDMGDGLLLVFMCQNDPGVCCEWEAGGGANFACVVPLQKLEPLAPPATGVTELAAVYGARAVVLADEETYDDARARWGKAPGQRRRDVLGKLGGNPDWLQGDETPTCNVCGKAMHFVAELEEGPDHKTAMNLGSGMAYVFICTPCDGPAQFLWQQ